MIASCRHQANLAAGIALAALVSMIALILGTNEAALKIENPVMYATTYVLEIVFGIAFFVALWAYIKAKGRSGWWILLMFFNLLGLLVIVLLKDKTKLPPEPKSPGAV